MEERSLNRILYVLLGIVCFLFWGELRRTWAARREALWDDRYIEAVRSSSEAWELGWRLEDLEARLHTQRYWAEGLKSISSIRSLRKGSPVSKSEEEVELGLGVEEDMASPEAKRASELLSVLSDETEYYEIECGSRPNKLVQVGPDEFRDMNDRCRAFSGLEHRLLGPQALWQIVPLEGDEGAIGFRSMSNGKFLRVKAPPPDAAFDATWLLETVSPLPGLAERFQLRQITKAQKQEEAPNREFPPAFGRLDDDQRLERRRRRRRRLQQFFEKGIEEEHYSLQEEAEALERPDWAAELPSPPITIEAKGIRAARSQTVMIYSELMRGYLQCHGSGISEPVQGFAGESILDESNEYYFNLSWVPNVDRQKKLIEASRYVKSLEAKATDASRDTNKNKDEADSKQVQRQSIALVIPMTSRGTEMQGVEQSPLWFNLFASFIESIDWRKNTHYFTFYLGFDLGDPLYDTGDAWSEMRLAFKSHARKALKWLGYGDWTIHRVIEGGDPRRTNMDDTLEQTRQLDTSVSNQPYLSLRLFHFDDTLGAPSQAVSGLARTATKDGADYIYQLNDDTILVSKDWVDEMIYDLRSSPLAPNLGVAGPLDTTNERILTHAFVHKTHVEIFDAMFPTAFRNWWSDDWISAVYGRHATFARRDVIVTHNVQSQKTGAWNRYDVDHSAQHLLHDQVQRGFVTINNWLRDRGYKTMPLPDICGYAPMMTRIYDTLLRHGL